MYFKAIYIRLVDMKWPLVVVILIYTHLMQVCWIVTLWEVSRLITQPLVYVRTSLLRRTFFSNLQLWRLAILEPLGVKLTSVAHLKALIIIYWNFDRLDAWQNFYYGPRPLEKGHFTPKNGYLLCGFLWIQLYGKYNFLHFPVN